MGQTNKDTFAINFSCKYNDGVKNMQEKEYLNNKDAYENMIDGNKYTDNKEAAELLGVSEHTMTKIRNAEGFEFTRLKRQVIINKKFLEEYMRKHRKIRY